MPVPIDLSPMTEKDIEQYLWSDVPADESREVPSWAAEQILSLTHVCGVLQAMSFEKMIDERNSE